MFIFTQNKNMDLTLADRQSFKVILSTIAQILNKANLSTQSNFINILIDSLSDENLDSFFKMINGINMWGGSGAVWEVYIEDTYNAQIFESEIINLIDLMEQKKIIGKGIKPIRKLFKENIKHEK